MRITPSLLYRNFLTNVGKLNEGLSRASDQVSTGKKLAHLQDSPSDSAELVDLRAQLSQIDQYRTNSENSLFLLGTTDSALNSSHSLVTTIFARGSLAASETLDLGSRTSVAREIRALRDELLAVANTQARGRYVFAGSQVSAPAFTILGDTVTYQGNTDVNTIQIGDGLQIPANVPGSVAFSSIFSSIQALVTALDSGSLPGIRAALGQFSSSLGSLGQTRAEMGAHLGKLQNIESEHDIRETSIRVRRSQIEDANLAEAITELNRIQMALRASLGAQSTVQQRNLFDFLG